MGKVIVIQFITLDGVIEDPDGRGGAEFGGWAFRFGREAIAGDVFRLGPVLDGCVVLFGHRTWGHFSRLWPERTDRFSVAMNRARKVVASTGSPDLTAWAGSERLDGDVVEGVARLAAEHDVVVIGSTSVVRALQAADGIDEYRLLTVPSVIGDANAVRLFVSSAELGLVSVDAAGPVVLTVLAARSA
ncbi:dihydrofolate reductase family protein [Agromyces sp. SYSU K20354]|uniref:dihydrofolate reductase family protein n=1 Tax=Agromyces cavernae TaxID=2898659 RepID=UPI001E292662|nr:dihydrofolate reductase family protein [Agromyces cavernae]MCD2443035.1 dihydrofolate reductase family protein [Agromyces cavernae]